jgi:hypothetical protein
MSGFVALTASGAIMVLQPTTLHPAQRPVERSETDDARSAKRERGKRYCIVLRFRHSTLDPGEISSELGRRPDIAWKAGDPCITPKGRRLPGVRADGFWSLTFRYKGEKPIGNNLAQIVDELSPHKHLFGKLDNMGATAALYVQLPGDVNNGDRISSKTLGRLADLSIDLEIEIFPEWR